MKKCYFQNFKIFTDSTDKNSIERLTKVFLTKKSSNFRFIARVVLDVFKKFK